MVIFACTLKSLVREASKQPGKSFLQMVWQVAAFIPPALSSLPKTHLAHTSELINFTILKGKSIAVVGAAAPHLTPPLRRSRAAQLTFTSLPAVLQLPASRLIACAVILAHTIIIASS